MENDLDYYRRRLNEERSSAARSDRPDVRIVHEKLATMYEARIGKLSRGSPGEGHAPVVQPGIFSRA